MYGRVLIMDDDMSVRNLATDMLSALGYFSRVARNGEEAIALYRHARQQEEAFHAVILDIRVEAGMGGGDAMRRLIEIDPDIRAIVSSGSCEHPFMKNHKDYGFKACLPKPYTLKQLLQALESTLKPVSDGALQTPGEPSPEETIE